MGVPNVPIGMMNPRSASGNGYGCEWRDRVGLMSPRAICGSGGNSASISPSSNDSSSAGGVIAGETGVNDGGGNDGGRGTRTGVGDMGAMRAPLLCVATASGASSAMSHGAGESATLVREDTRGAQEHNANASLLRPRQSLVPVLALALPMQPHLK